MNSVGLVSIGTLKVGNIPTITKVIVNGPATVILWSDGTKTVAKCSPQEPFDFEKGVAIAIAKRFVSGNELKESFKSAEEQCYEFYSETFQEWVDKFSRGFMAFSEELKK